MVAEGQEQGWTTRLSAFFYRHRGLKLSGFLGAPLLWLLVVYLGSLALMLVAAFWRVDSFTGDLVRQWGTQNFVTLWSVSVYRTIAVRTVGIAVAVSLTDIVLAFPLAYYAARMATPRRRNMVLIAVVVPLWANYLVRLFAWRLILSSGGFLTAMTQKLGFHLDLGNTNWAIWLTFSYLWLPFVLLPIYAALERVPSSYLEASGDLGAKGWMTFRRVVFPLVIPGIVAGTIFSFSLTLGDYIVPQIVGNTKFIGNAIYDSFGVANDLPFAAAYALVPIGVMAVYLFMAKRLGAFEAL
ncbi:MAG: putative spermidine/putrescine transport system permease protein [Actinomycetota bacterium]|nr:putative spermidine/putrescine transport system permease protein [Actinomycetota bacterium]